MEKSESSAGSFMVLIEKLHELSLKGLNNSKEADMIRDDMDFHWKWMSKKEHRSVQLYSALLRNLENANSREK